MKSQLLFKAIKHKTSTFFITATVAVTAINTYFFLNYQLANSESPLAATDQTLDLDAVAALGYIEPKGETIQLSVPSSMEGTRVERLLVKRGDLVKAGQTIAILDNRDRLQAALLQAQAQVTVAKARLAQIRAGTKAGDVRAAEARFQGTQAELDGQIAAQRATIANLEAQLQGQKSAQEATIERIKAELDNAKTECSRYQMLYRDGAISAQERDNFCLQETTLRKRLKEAQANLNRIVATYQEQIAEARANLNRTVGTVQKQIEEAQGTFDAVAEVRPVDVEVALAELEAAKADVRRAEAELDLAYVKSPIDGMILEVHTQSGEVMSDRGIAEIGQTDQMYVMAEVYETDISRVRLGQTVTIKTDGILQNLQGVVEEIGLLIGTQDVLGTDPVADADARVVEVKIRLSPEDSKLVEGLTNLRVNAIIDTSSSPHSERADQSD
ncbi:ABC exporter membrane fusion protein [Pleurocapsales cyanobacterium LEGE 10410]|nr:ABC exporter membrane fusion protein [Pleurocapsales cyanobacterium LEGE 10410]